MMHVQMARLADCPELAMTEADAKTLMVAAQNVLRHYSIAATQRAVDWMTFCSVATFMYAPRVVALRRRTRRPGSSARSSPDGGADSQTGPAQVFQFHPPGPVGPIIDMPPSSGPH
jgi:hypothetical protein